MSHRSIKKLTSLFTFFAVLCISGVAFAQGSGKEMAVAANSGLIAIGASFGLGIAALGGALARAALPPPPSTVSPATPARPTRSAAR